MKLYLIVDSLTLKVVAHSTNKPAARALISQSEGVHMQTIQQSNLAAFLTVYGVA